MAKGSPLKKLVNGEIADADDVNQIIEDAGSQGGLIPYDPATNNQVTNGSQSIGSTAFPWGSIFLNRLANFVEVDPSTNTAAASIAINLLRKFISMKDAPGNGVGTYVGNGGSVVSVKVDESGLEFTPPSDIPKNIQVFTNSGTWTRPAGVNQVYVKVIGGGGTGGAGTTGSGGGGGGGGYSEGLITVSGNVTVTIGTTNSFAGGATIQATKGSNGSASTGSAGTLVAGSGGAGGTGSNGTINLSGSNGTGGSNGGSGGTGGGNAMGSGGGGGRSDTRSGNTGDNGGAGVGYGGGGGGGGSSNSSSTTGGAGDPGAVIVYW